MSALTTSVMFYAVALFLGFATAFTGSGFPAGVGLVVAGLATDLLDKGLSERFQGARR